MYRVFNTMLIDRSAVSRPWIMLCETGANKKITVSGTPLTPPGPPRAGADARAAGVRTGGRGRVSRR